MKLSVKCGTSRDRDRCSDGSGRVEIRRNLIRIFTGRLKNPAALPIMALQNDDPITVTSRPLRDIDGGFRGARHILQLSVDDISPAVAGHDNCAYVSAELEGLSGLGGKQPAALVEKADELLGWARLACEHTKARHLTSSPLDFLISSTLS